jgi:hypothetical protein
MKSINKVEDLVRQGISSVCFVQDYVEFHFGGPFPILRSISNPRISVAGTEYVFPQPRSRDALCGVIGSTARTVNIKENSFLELTTSGDCKITIPLDAESLREGEAMHFVPEPGGMQVW